VSVDAKSALWLASFSLTIARQTLRDHALRWINPRALQLPAAALLDRYGADICVGVELGVAVEVLTSATSCVAAQGVSVEFLEASKSERQARCARGGVNCQRAQVSSVQSQVSSLSRGGGR
jgi:hypothetical protein